MRTELRAVDVPPSLLNCAPAPQAPAAGATQKAVAAYVINLKASRDECELKVNKIGKLVKNQQKAVKDSNDQESGQVSEPTPAGEEKSPDWLGLGQIP